jgi:hypothetical protein
MGISYKLFDAWLKCYEFNIWQIITYKILNFYLYNDILILKLYQSLVGSILCSFYLHLCLFHSSYAFFLLPCTTIPLESLVTYARCRWFYFWYIFPLVTCLSHFMLWMNQSIAIFSSMIQLFTYVLGPDFRCIELKCVFYLVKDYCAIVAGSNPHWSENFSSSLTIY